MIHVEEVLAIVAEDGIGLLHQVVDQDVGMDLAVDAELGDDRRVDAVGVILELVLRDGDRVFPMLVLDRETVGRQALQRARADPFAELRGLAEPRIHFRLGGRRRLGRDLVPGDRRRLEGLVEEGPEADERGVKVDLVDNHGASGSVR